MKNDHLEHTTNVGLAFVLACDNAARAVEIQLGPPTTHGLARVAPMQRFTVPYAMVAELTTKLVQLLNTAEVKPYVLADIMAAEVAQ